MPGLAGLGQPATDFYLWMLSWSPITHCWWYYFAFFDYLQECGCVLAVKKQFTYLGCTQPRSSHRTQPNKSQQGENKEEVQSEGSRTLTVSAQRKGRWVFPAVSKKQCSLIQILSQFCSGAVSVIWPPLISSFFWNHKKPHRTSC